MLVPVLVPVRILHDNNVQTLTAQQNDPGRVVYLTREQVAHCIVLMRHTQMIADTRRRENELWGTMTPGQAAHPGSHEVQSEVCDLLVSWGLLDPVPKTEESSPPEEKRDVSLLLPWSSLLNLFPGRYPSKRVSKLDAGSSANRGCMVKPDRAYRQSGESVAADSLVYKPGFHKGRWGELYPLGATPDPPSSSSKIFPALCFSSTFGEGLEQNFKAGRGPKIGRRNHVLRGPDETRLVGPSCLVPSRHIAYVIVEQPPICEFPELFPRMFFRESPDIFGPSSAPTPSPRAQSQTASPADLIESEHIHSPWPASRNSLSHKTNSALELSASRLDAQHSMLERLLERIYNILDSLAFAIFSAVLLIALVVCAVGYIVATKVLGLDD
jgi:hypothetical protein